MAKAASVQPVIDMVRPGNQVEICVNMWRVHPAVKLGRLLANDAAG
jgi:hypothetical protein